MSRATAYALLGLALTGALGASIVFGGYETYSPARIVEILTRPAGEFPPPDRVALVSIRLPRALSGALVGAALAVSGVLLQGLFRNPLASPGILGATSGGAFGAVVALAAGLTSTSVLFGPLASFAGTFVAVFTVYLLSIDRYGVHSTYLILCGVAVNTIFAAATSLVLTLSLDRPDVGRQIVYWLAGGLGHATWPHVWILAVSLLLSLAGSVFVARDLNLLALGEESARSLGARLEVLKPAVLLLATLATGAAVAVSGMIGFIGLVVPHILRLLLGPDHRGLLLSSALGGGALLVLADLLAVKLLWPTEIRVGIITSLLGGPFFLFLLMRERRRTFGP